MLSDMVTNGWAYSSYILADLLPVLGLCMGLSLSYAVVSLIKSVVRG